MDIEENSNTKFIITAVIIAILVGNIITGIKLYKDSKDRMDNMEEQFEKLKKENDERYKTYTSDYIEVPDVTGMKVGEAIHLLEDYGFVISDHRILVKTDEVPVGTVVKTVPQKGSKRIRGTEIDLYIASEE